MRYNLFNEGELMYILLFIVFIMIVSLIIIFIIIVILKKLDLVDCFNFRKVYMKFILVMGGMVILFFFLIGIWFGYFIECEVKLFILGVIIMYMVGLIDDIYDLRFYLKLVG